jgi:hypothetical protein
VASFRLGQNAAPARAQSAPRPALKTMATAGGGGAVRKAAVVEDEWAEF